MDGNSLKFFGIGGMIAIGGVWMVKRARARAARCSVTTIGRIVRVEAKTSFSGGRGHHRPRREYHPIIEYSADGRTFEKNAGVYSSNKGKYNVGDLMEVRYNPDDRGEFVVKGSSGIGAGIGLLVLVLVLVGMGFMTLSR